ncbi:restriction endonuclease subunit S [Akkermansiaceae bacterium]|nr:restriction endonuclease subunit S [bacterium]MDA7656388.1 restriction endonuclease subunit S [Akkermansiaceae bacterium]MDB4391010.1 restriction endonuclease subunit S [Akkermansiaceae bacterium]
MTAIAGKSVPELRFPEFCKDWLRKPLKSLSSKSISYGIVQTGSDVKDGVKCVRVVDLTKPRIDLSELITTTEKISQSYKKTILTEGEIMVALRGMIGLVATVPRELEGSNLTRGIARISPKISEVHSAYLLWALRSPEARMEFLNQVNGSALKEIPIGGLNKVKVQLTTLPEQKKIADFLTSVDDRIGQLIKKKALLEDYKKGVMQQLFSQQIRFKDDNGNDFPDWEEKKLGEILKLEIRPIKMKDASVYSLITVKRGNRGVVSRGEYEGRKVLVKSQFEVRTGDFVISKRQIVHQACGIVPSSLNGSIVSNEYNVFGPTEECDLQYFDYFTFRPQMRHAFFLSCVGVHLEKMLFKTNDWLKRKFYFPTLPEQKKIADFLTSVDRKIESVSQQITKTQTFKKGLLQQMFV